MSEMVPSPDCSVRSPRTPKDSRAGRNVRNVRIWRIWGVLGGWMSEIFPLPCVLYAAPGPPKTLWNHKELAGLEEVAGRRGRGGERKDRSQKPVDDGKHAASMMGVAFSSLVEKQGECRGGRWTRAKDWSQKSADDGKHAASMMGVA